MIQRTVFWVLAAIALGCGVALSAAPKTSTSLISSSSPSESPPSTSASPSKSAFPSASASPSKSASPSASASPSKSASPTSSFSLSSSLSPSSSPASLLSSPSPSFTFSSSPVSTTPSLSSSASSMTSSAVLTSSVMSSSAPIQSSSMPASPATVSPSPTVAPGRETFSITNADGQVCLRGLLEVLFEVKYQISGTDKPNVTNIPLNGNSSGEVTGNCTEQNANFTFLWNEKGKNTSKHQFSMSFENHVKDQWKVTEVKAVFNTSDSFVFPNASEGQGNIIAQTSDSGIAANEHQAYICNSGYDLTFGKVTAHFMKIKLQPFSKAKLADDGQHCPADGKPDDDDNTVPIAVGAALGGLVLIVLVAYVIGRRRSKRGYEQV